MVVVSHCGGASRYSVSVIDRNRNESAGSLQVCSRSLCRPPGPAGQLGDAASGRRSAGRDRGLLDDHPAATLALRWAAAQRAAPHLAPNTWGGLCCDCLCRNPGVVRGSTLQSGGCWEALLGPADSSNNTLTH